MISLLDHQNAITNFCIEFDLGISCHGVLANTGIYADYVVYFVKPSRNASCTAAVLAAWV